ncbi:hypothetical protein F2Q70_00043328 [Brassica cretica]|uniref:Uncharacterized protein n=1 Tax=Brassica cretica TaxID=69181 RepID=A0A8S9KNB7_BRACR|nr:hypothetical protein F2Q70_00043328 [Brassica cretica]
MILFRDSSQTLLILDDFRISRRTDDFRISRRTDDFRISRRTDDFRRKKENHLFKWVDDALLDEIRRVEAEQGRIVEEIEDLKSSITQTIEEEVRKQKNSLELGCLGSILWLFGRLRSQE